MSLKEKAVEPKLEKSAQEQKQSMGTPVIVTESKYKPLSKSEQLVIGEKRVVVQEDYIKRAIAETKMYGNFLRSFRDLAFVSGLGPQDIADIYKAISVCVARNEVFEIQVPVSGQRSDISLNLKIDTTVKSIEGGLAKIIELSKGNMLAYTKKGEEYSENKKFDAEFSKLNTEVDKSALSHERKLAYLQFLSFVKKEKSWAMLKICRETFDLCSAKKEDAKVDVQKMYSLADMITGYVGPKTGPFKSKTSYLVSPTFGIDNIYDSFLSLGVSKAEVIPGTQKRIYEAGISASIDLHGQPNLWASVTLGNIIGGSVSIMNGDFSVGLSTLQLVSSKGKFDAMIAFGKMGGVEGIIKVPTKMIAQAPWLLAIPAAMSLVESSFKAYGLSSETTDSMLAFGMITGMFYPAPVYTAYEFFSMIDYMIPDRKKYRHAYENYEKLVEATVLLRRGKTNPALAKIEGVVASSVGSLKGFALAFEDEGIMQETIHLHGLESLDKSTAIIERIEKHMKTLDSIKSVTANNKEEFFASYTYLITKMSPYSTGDRQVFPLYFKDEKAMFRYFELMNKSTEILRKYAISSKTSDRELQYLSLFASQAIKDPYAKIAMAYEKFEKDTGKQIQHPIKTNYLHGIALRTADRLKTIITDNQMSGDTSIITEEKVDYLTQMKALSMTQRTMDKFFAEFMDLDSLEGTIYNSQLFSLTRALQEYRNSASYDPLKYSKLESKVIGWLRKNKKVYEYSYSGSGSAPLNSRDSELRPNSRTSKRVVFSLENESEELWGLVKKQEKKVKGLKEDVMEGYDDLEAPELASMPRSMPVSLSVDAAFKAIELYAKNTDTALKDVEAAQRELVIGKLSYDTVVELTRTISEIDASLELVSYSKENKKKLEEIRESLSDFKDGLMGIVKTSLELGQKAVYLEEIKSTVKLSDELISKSGNQSYDPMKEYLKKLEKDL